MGKECEVGEVILHRLLNSLSPLPFKREGLTEYRAAAATDEGISASSHAANYAATGTPNQADNHGSGDLTFMLGARENFN